MVDQPGSQRTGQILDDTDIKIGFNQPALIVEDNSGEFSMGLFMILHAAVMDGRLISLLVVEMPDCIVL